MNIVEILETRLEKIAGAVIARPKLSLWICLACVFIFSLGMARMYIDVTNESMFRAGDPTLTQFRQFQSQFGRDDTALAAIESPAIFTPKFLKKLKAYHQDLEKEVPYLDRVTSLVNVTSVSSSNNDEILIDDLENRWPTEEENFPAFKRAIIENPLYKNLLVSSSSNVTLLFVRANVFADNEAEQTGFEDKLVNLHDRLMAWVKGQENKQTEVSEDDFFSDMDLKTQTTDNVKTQPLTTPQLQAFIRSVKKITERHQSNDFVIRLAGSAIIADEHATSIHLDVAKLLPFVFLLVFLLLYVMLRRLSATLIPLLVVTLTLMATLGFMGWISSPVTPVVVALPPLILTIGVAGAVHILSSFYARYETSKDRNESIIYAVKKTGTAVVFTSLTTIAGFLAFMIADLKPIADFGLLIAFGVAVALVLAIVLIPAVLALSRFRIKQSERKQWNIFIAPMLKLTQFGLNNAGKVLIAVVVIVAVSIPGLAKLQFSHNTLEWFAEDNSVRVNTLWVDDIFSGTIPLEIIVDTNKKGGLYEPELMRRLEQFQAYAETLNLSVATMGRSTSVVDTLKQIHLVLNKGTPDALIPRERALIAQELLLFEGSGTDNVSELVDSDFSQARLTVRMSWLDAIDYLPVRQQLINHAKENFKGLAKVHATGTIDLISRVVVGVIQSMISSYLIASIVIALMLILLLRSFTLGMISMVPNFLPIVFSLSLMGYAGLPIDMFTVLLGGIALGLVVDDTVHFMHSYRYHRYTLGLSVEESIEQIVLKVGPALLFTTVALTLGFLILGLSSMSALSLFGVMIGITMVNALLVDLLVTPALIKVAEQQGLFSKETANTKFDNV